MTTQSTQTPEAWGEPRSKTVTWHDPQLVVAAREGLSGLEHLRAWAGGAFPSAPISQLMGFTMAGAEEGEVRFEGTPDESVCNPMGAVHGGLMCTLLDSATGCAVQSTLPVGVGYTSVEIKVSYLRPVFAGTPLSTRGWVVKPGRRMAFAEADIRDPQGKVVATASSSCLVFEL
ncbi:PaaI family thioesterase [Nocardiopsis sp. HNM0947]|uniref:PaaI family thioesterase n=1 Tax=Nocardiopsis coralli TaxID=2772213 RepID=A0ABR9PCH1_9ACTN|nr:PaaI family thioesterase [Nocardiopsis coralli]MBE3001546.1 PaaI family thioesterase [Nocardiopsis coralli]